MRTAVFHESFRAEERLWDSTTQRRWMLGFTLALFTLAPIARELIVKQLLTKEERAWVDAYHARVRAEIGPQLDGDAKAWLETATAPL